jgi:hypothetical protein
VPTIWAGDAKNAANFIERLFARLQRKSLERAA